MRGLLGVPNARAVVTHAIHGCIVPATMRAPAFLLLLAAVTSCEERTQSRGVASAAQGNPVPPPADSAPVAAPSSSTTARCIVPLGAPAPVANPAAACPDDPTGNLNLAHRWVSFPGAASAPRVAVELADNPTSRERGLMYRTSMPEDQGMLFSWSEESPRAFWMRNTCIPLDMLFIAEDLTILGIVEQVPPMNEVSRGIPCPAAHVLELNAGWARSHGLAPGQKIVVES
jgi:uncharacterized membrane protein (UPF0127 family)